MKVLELFAGTHSIGKVFEKCGHSVFSVECNKHFENIDLYCEETNMGKVNKLFDLVRL